MVTGNYPINWKTLAAAVEFYRNRHFKYIEVPWIVSDKSLRATMPDNHLRFQAEGSGTFGFLVGSAEQSFLELEGKSQLVPGKYVACTPCFRDDKVDFLHQTTFMKVELYQTIDVNEKSLEQMIGNTITFFRLNMPSSGILEKIETDDGWDIVVNGIEVGSYGIRQYGTHKWIYGTGVAEPRFSQANSK